MRSIFLLGGFLGFGVTLLGGLIAGREMPLILRDAAIGCLVMALVFRWFWSRVVRSFHETARIKQAAAKAAEMAVEEADLKASKDGSSALPPGRRPVAMAAAEARR